eukprot:8084971-Pyramimonas_sp.AAC.2
MESRERSGWLCDHSDISLSSTLSPFLPPPEGRPSNVDLVVPFQKKLHKFADWDVRLLPSGQRWEGLRPLLLPVDL